MAEEKEGEKVSAANSAGWTCDVCGRSNQVTYANVQYVAKAAAREAIDRARVAHNREGLSMFKKFLAWLKKLLADHVAAPYPAPEPPAPTGPQDELDMALVIWDEPLSPAKWPITATLSNARGYHDGIGATVAGADLWPLRNDGGSRPTVGNWCLIAKTADGRWRGSAIEWYARGANRCSGKRWDGTDDIHGPLTFWRPKSGEEVYVMVCGAIRGAPYTIQERSQTARATMP